MPYQITRLTSSTQVKSIAYFLDANVWIFSIEYWNDPLRDGIYAEFFEKIISSDLDPLPKILMPSMLISEIINTYLRQIAMPDYIKRNADIEFKDYRKTAHYRAEFTKILDEIKNYKDSLLFIGDDNIISPFPSYMNHLSYSLDFNDNYYIYVCNKYRNRAEVMFVTNDGGFELEDFPILTANRTLLNLK